MERIVLFMHFFLDFEPQGIAKCSTFGDQFFYVI